MTPAKLLTPSIAEFIARKRMQNRRANYVDYLEYELLRLVDRIGDLPLAEITAEAIERTLDPKWTPSMTRSVLVRYSTFFADCVRREHILKNPVNKIDRPTVDRKAPAVFSVRDVIELLRIVHKERPDLLAYVVVGTFLGVRPHEIGKLQWKDVDTTLRPLRGVDEPHGLLTIDAAASKVRRRRIVPIPPMVISWLRLCDTAAPMGPTKTPTRPVAKLAKMVGVKWSHDIMRHTGATYLLARYEDAPRVALWLGNSPSILLTFYYQLIRPEDCLAFWSITPTL
jgi:integrase